MVWYSISREDRYIEFFYFPISEKKEPCFQGEAERQASKIFGNRSREQPIFLQLKDYFWVKTPSTYELPFGTKGSEDLLLRVLAITSYSIPESIKSLECRRCVVVGNGHRLRNSSLGGVINKYDVVIRLNNAPVAGYEGDVGSKTTIRLFYPESAHFDPKIENNPDTLLVLVAFKAMDFHWIETILSDKKRVRKGFWKQPPLIWDVNPKQVRILNPFFMEIAADKLLSLPIQQPRKIKQKPTTGLLAITLALHLCDLVHIAGFGYPDASNKKQTIHYYEQITLKSMADLQLFQHRVLLEFTPVHLQSKNGYSVPRRRAQVHLLPGEDEEMSSKDGHLYPLHVLDCRKDRISFCRHGCYGTEFCRPGWPQTHKALPASVSEVLGLKVCATITQRLRDPGEWPEDSPHQNLVSSTRWSETGCRSTHS